MNKTFNSRVHFRRWLKKAANIFLISVSVSGSTSQLYTNIASTQKLYQSISESGLTLPKGQYIVSYGSSQEEEHSLVQTKYIFAISTQEHYVGGAQTGDVSKLIESLEGAEYVITQNTKTPGYQILSLLAIQPNGVLELDSLIASLKKHCRFVAIDDGSGRMNFDNVFIGRNDFVQEYT
ncbi:hypothetical protein [Salinivibrio sp. IB643]|uniref:hypothetical protein n=1 Tax=Salinivibrio sp. IB643 TaxID=1909445 RepID=UPI000988DAB3|nr:hypothetical protein [Salinivibrio sp. IB643]OOE93995.1 hypothetical protein BZG77_14260 [Salinivibrio sp. IB643]